MTIAIKFISKCRSITESDDNKRYREAAAKMIANIKLKSPDWVDTDGSVEQSFYDNMIAMKNGKL